MSGFPKPLIRLCYIEDLFSETDKTIIKNNKEAAYD